MWSAQGTAVKFLAPDESASDAAGATPRLRPIAVTFLPFYVATLLLVPLLFRLRRRDKRTAWPNSRDWGRFAVAGVVGQVLARGWALPGA